jgi:hypothetical protein
MQMLAAHLVGMTKGELDRFAILIMYSIIPFVYSDSNFKNPSGIRQSSWPWPAQQMLSAGVSELLNRHKCTLDA